MRRKVNISTLMVFRNQRRRRIGDMEGVLSNPLDKSLSVPNYTWQILSRIKHICPVDNFWTTTCIKCTEVVHWIDDNFIHCFERVLDTPTPGQIGTRTDFGSCVRHFSTKTNRHPDNSAPQLDKSAPQKDKSELF
jgi:hypothetical protein